MRTPPLYLLFCPERDPETIVFSSPYDLFRDAQGLTGWLNACGESEDCLPGGRASDYDKLAALCRALPLSPGYALRRRVLTLLADGFGWRKTDPAPLELWSWLAEELSPGARNGDVTLSALAARFGADTGTADGRQVRILPEGYGFCRPDPYHAAICREKEAAGEVLSRAERDLLFTQRVRETAEGCLARSCPLELIGQTAQLERLADYLAAVHRLPELTCTLTDPACGDTPPVFPADVRAGLCLFGNDTPKELEAKLTAMAARTPLLALDCVRLMVRDATDLGQIGVWRGILQNFLNQET